METSGSRLLHDPRVRALIARRQQRSIVLTLVVSVFYAAVAIGCAFQRDLMGLPVLGSAVSLGLVSMVAVIVVGVVAAGYYTWWSNTVRDPLAAQILDSSAEERG